MQVEALGEVGKLRRVPLVGELVALDVSGRALHVDSGEVIAENIDGRSFSIGEVTVVDGAELIIHWYGTYAKKPLEGDWLKSWLHKKDNKVKHSSHIAGKPYGTWETAHWVNLHDVIGEPFQLVDRKLPAFIVMALEKRELQRSKNTNLLREDRKLRVF